LKQNYARIPLMKKSEILSGILLFPLFYLGIFWAWPFVGWLVGLFLPTELIKAVTIFIAQPLLWLVPNYGQTDNAAIGPYILVITFIGWPLYFGINLLIWLWRNLKNKTENLQRLTYLFFKQAIYIPLIILGTISLSFLLG